MLQFYHYAACSTCRNAKKWLESRQYTFEAIDITTHPPSKSQLQKILQISGQSIMDLLNKSGEQYRALNMKEKIKTLTEDQILDSLSKNGRLIKRPLVFGESKATIGYKEEVFQKNWP